MFTSLVRNGVLVNGILTPSPSLATITMKLEPVFALTAMLSTPFTNEADILKEAVYSVGFSPTVKKEAVTRNGFILNVLSANLVVTNELAIIEPPPNPSVTSNRVIESTSTEPDRRVRIKEPVIPDAEAVTAY